MKSLALAAFLTLAVACRASGEDRPLRVAPSQEAPSARLATAVLDPPILPPEAPRAVQEMPRFEKRPRAGALQSVFFSATGVEAEVDELSIAELDFSTTVGFPLPTREAPLLITPSFGWDLLRNHDLDLPGAFYDASLELRHLKPISERWTLDLAVTPGIFGNDETSESLMRLQGRALGMYKWSPETKVILGFVYLDREDVSALPAAGLIWTPTDWFKLDLLFPRPRASICGRRDSRAAWWLYLGGEFGGGSWGVTREDGRGDAATLNDLRLLAGIERQSIGLTLKMEAGYVFSRQLEYRSGIGDQDLGEAGLIRAVVAY